MTKAIVVLYLTLINFKYQTMNLNNDFWDFLKLTELYKLKKIDRNSSNNYFETKTKIHISRKETVAEHVYSCLKLADYFFSLKLEN